MKINRPLTTKLKNNYLLWIRRKVFLLKHWNCIWREKKPVHIYFFKGPPSRSLFLLGFAVFIKIKHHMKYSYYRQWRHKESALPVCFFVRGPEWQLSLLLPSATPTATAADREHSVSSVRISAAAAVQVLRMKKIWNKSFVDFFHDFSAFLRPPTAFLIR